MKVYISADMEGITGIVDGNQTGGPTSEYARGCKFMTQDVNAAVDGALEAGATGIYVKDAHAEGRNILLEELRKEARLIPGWDAMMSMVQGIDETFDALILIGYHAMSGTEKAILSHTYSGIVKELSFNGQAVGEPEISALLAGHYGVPVVFISGDELAVKELTGFVGKIPHAITKHGMDRKSATVMHPDLTRQAISKGVAEALSDLSKFKPFQMELPIKASLKLSAWTMTDLISFVPGVVKVSSDEVVYEAQDVISLAKVFRVMMGLAWSQK